MLYDNFHLRNEPEYCLNEMLSHFEINTNEPIVLEEIADLLNVVIKREVLSDGIIGGFMAKGLRRLIVIDPCIVDNCFYRFVLAHEIGHILMHHYLGCCAAERFSIMDDDDEFEHNANLFAFMLLMPKKAISKDIAEKVITFQLVEELSEKWQAPLSDMLINLAWTTLTQTIVIKIKDDKIQWHGNSEACRNVTVLNESNAKHLMDTQDLQSHPASNFLTGVSVETMCQVEARYIDDGDYHLCILRLFDSKQ